ncbi:hypothetical protein Hanom_Chr01g00082091 [Helianthus anomalus]
MILVPMVISQIQTSLKAHLSLEELFCGSNLICLGGGMMLLKNSKWCTFCGVRGSENLLYIITKCINNINTKVTHYINYLWS